MKFTDAELNQILFMIRRTEKFYSEIANDHSIPYEGQKAAREEKKKCIDLQMKIVETQLGLRDEDLPLQDSKPGIRTVGQSYRAAPGVDGNEPG
jgi:hypothetical protein